MRTRLVNLIFAAAAPLLAGDPMLVIDSHGHTGDVRKMIFTKDGRKLISAGDDKMVRIWDVERGKTERTIWGEIGEGKLGKIYALALSRDEQYLAVGGYFEKDASPIRIYNFSTGTMAFVLPGHTNVVLSLAFSPDGKFLASAAGDGTIRIWDMQARREFQKQRQQGNVNFIGSAVVAFSPDGNYLASCYFDRKVVLWSFRDGSLKKDNREPPPARGPIVSLVFSPVGLSVAYSSYDNSIRLYNIAAKQETILSPDEGPAWLAFDAGGKQLLTAPTDRRAACKILAVADRRVLRSFPEQRTEIYAVAISPDGKAATAVAGTHAIYLWDLNSGASLKELSGVGQAIFQVAFAKDDASIAYGTRWIDNPKFNSYAVLQKAIHIPHGDIRDRGLGLLPGRAEISAYLSPTISEGEDELRLSPDSRLLEPMHKGKALNQLTKGAGSGWEHRSATYTPDMRFFVDGGGDGDLRLFETATGKEKLEYLGHTGNIWSVAVSRDSKTLVSASDDQTIRMWELETGHNLVTFFLARDGEWVAFTPEGYYASSLHGDDYVGWQVNRGREREAQYFTVAQFQKQFYRPEVVAAQIEQHDIRQAIKQANETPLSAADIANSLPAEISRLSKSTEPDGTLRLQAAVSSDSLPIEQVVLYLNGFPRILKFADGGDPTKRQVDERLTLLPGKNSIFLTASTGKSTSRGVEAEAIGPVADPKKPPPKPDLYVLLAGITEYDYKATNLPVLKYAAQDARDFLAALQRQQGVMFGKVDYKILLDKDVTPENLRRELNWLKKSALETDYKLLFLAGHGAPDGGNNYHFLCHDHRESPDRDGKPVFDNDMPWHDLVTPLEGPGRSILIVDTCHAAQASSDEIFTRVEKNIAAAILSLVTFAASMGTENSQENEALGHGVFTKALLDELSDQTQQHGGVIYTDELGVALRKRVTGFVGEDGQHPVYFILPNGLPAYPLFKRP